MTTAVQRSPHVPRNVSSAPAIPSPVTVERNDALAFPPRFLQPPEWGYRKRSGSGQQGVFSYTVDRVQYWGSRASSQDTLPILKVS